MHMPVLNTPHFISVGHVVAAGSVVYEGHCALVVSNLPVLWAGTAPA